MDREFEQTIIRHQDSVLACLFALVRNRELAEDLLQETFVVAYTHRENLAAVRDVGAWLRTVARRRAYRALGKSSAGGAALWREGMELEETGASESLGDQESLARQLEMLRECRKSLTPQQQRVVELFYDGGKSGDEAAAELGVNRRTVFQTLYVARKNLLECVRRRLRQEEEQ